MQAPPRRKLEIIDIDFDDASGVYALFQHIIEAGRAISTHPDGNHLTYVPDAKAMAVSAKSAKAMAVSAKRAEERRLRDEAKADEDRAKQLQNEIDAKAKQFSALTVGWNYNSKRPAARVDEHGELLFNMKLGEPLMCGQSRFWKDYVMVNKDDFQKWHATRVGAVEVCRGHGKIIFRLA